MNANSNTLPAPAASTKTLWAAVGVLGIAVVALGASLVHLQSRPVDGHAALAAINSAPPTTLTPAAAVTVPESLSQREDLVAPPAKPPVALARPSAPRPPAKPTAMPAPVASPVAAPTPAPTPMPAPTPAPAPVVAGNNGTGEAGGIGVVTNAGVIPSQPMPVTARPICSHCGTVEAVTPIQRNAKSGTGVGAVAGGALGAVVGNQIGKGGGRTIATILGAVGGGLAGNAIEKNMKKETVYQVQVRMEDGSLRTIEQSTPASVGAKITLDGSVPNATAESSASRIARPAPGVRSTSPHPDDRV